MQARRGSKVLHGYDVGLGIQTQIIWKDSEHF